MDGMYPSLSDIAAVTRNSGDGFGGEGSWAWVLIFLIFALGGWGRNGNGFGGNNGGIGENYALATDFATLERKLDGVNNGLCDGFYAMAQQFSNTNQNIANSTASLQQTLCQGFSGINQAIMTNGYETRLGVNNLGYQLSNCCCDLKTQIADCCCTLGRGLDGINYNMATNTNALQQTLCNNTRDIIENQNANYRAIHEELVANKLEMKNDRIAEQQNEINALRLAASQEKQNNYLISQLKPCPEPAYVVNGPTPVNFPTNCCGTFNGFGCNATII